MFSWIARAFGAVSGAIDETVRRWVHDLINGLYSVLHTIFHFVGGAWIEVYKAAGLLRTMWDYFAGTVVLAFHDLLHVIIPGVLHWAASWINLLRKFIEDVYHWAIREFDYITHWVLHLLDDLRHWVLTDIWKPLFDFIAMAWRWITHEGYLVYFYVTHPDKLIDLVWDALLHKIEREAWTAGKLLGRFFLSLVVHNLRAFVTLVEDIIAAIL